MKDYYRILGVKPEDSDEVIKKTYRKLAKGTHPDKGWGTAGEEWLKELNVAYDALKTPEARKRYDSKRNGSTGSSPGSQTGQQNQSGPTSAAGSTPKYKPYTPKSSAQPKTGPQQSQSSAQASSTPPPSSRGNQGQSGAKASTPPRGSASQGQNQQSRASNPHSGAKPNASPGSSAHPGANPNSAYSRGTTSAPTSTPKSANQRTKAYGKSQATTGATIPSTSGTQQSTGRVGAGSGITWLDVVIVLHRITVFPLLLYASSFGVLLIFTTGGFGFLWFIVEIACWIWCIVGWDL